MLFCSTSHHCLGLGKGLISREKGFLPVQKMQQRELSGIVYLQGAFLCEFFIFLYLLLVLLLIFLTSLLFPVSCLYLNLWSLPFVPPVGGGAEGGFSRSTKLENIIFKP